ncbi:response regulator [Actinokineospora soli]|uniref:Response regulator n=1 Tax=Actinokineospora soli TaxID=1048753 RepID=A0ABW2TR06_9PSEU
MAIRLVVVDGHPLIRCGLVALGAASPDIEVVGEADTAAAAPAAVAGAAPDVVTIDVSLPDGDGLALARALRDAHPELGIVVLTSLGEDDVLFRAIDTGASAFVSKSAPAAEVLGAIRHAAVAAGSFTATGLLGALTRRQDRADRFPLSPRETEVLSLLRDGLSVRAIAGCIFVSHSTAKTYVARLYEKLGAANRAEALMIALRHRLISVEDPAVAV